MISELALAIQHDVVIPDEIFDILDNKFESHWRKSTMNGKYTVYFLGSDFTTGDTYEMVTDTLLPWLRTLPMRFDDNQDLIEKYQMVIYTDDDGYIGQEHYGYRWFEITVGIRF
jgi:hypothetical protein